MAITPSPGYMLNPADPTGNSVVPIGSESTVNNPNAGYQYSGGTPTPTPPPASSAPPSPTTQPPTPPAPAAPPASPPASPPAPTQPAGQVPQTNLQPGAQGDQVKALQDYLVQQGLMTPQQVATGPGVYGPQTQAAVAALQQKLGLQAGQYAGFYGPQTRAALEKKYQDAYSAMTGDAPESGSNARAALEKYFADRPEESNTQDDYFDALSKLNPVESTMFQTLAGLLSAQNTQQSLRDLYAQEVAAQGIPGLNMELADLNRIMDGTEDDIRDEITNTGGFATESQIQALTGARNKTLLKRANYLSDLIQSKNDYVDTIMSLTKADREQVSKDLDRKLGITEMMFNMNQQMTNAARQNYQSIVQNIGYDGLVDSVSSPQELESIARTLGMKPQTLLELSKNPTTQQRAQELDMLNYDLSVDKFEEDKRQFGLSYALEQQKLAEARAANAISKYSLERASRTLDSVADIRPDVNENTVGFSSLKAIIPGTAARNFQAKLVNLKSSIAQGELNEMREASKTGGALGQVAVQEIEMLQSSLGALDQAQSVEQFNTQLNKVEENVWRWNAQKMSAAYGYDYQGAKQQGYSDQEIYDYLKNQ